MYIYNIYIYHIIHSVYIYIIYIFICICSVSLKIYLSRCIPSLSATQPMNISGWGPKGMLRSMSRLSQRSAQVEPCRGCRVWMYRMFFQSWMIRWIFGAWNCYIIYIHTLWSSNTLLFAIVNFPWIDGLTLKNMLIFPSYVELPEGMLSIYIIYI